MTATLNGSARGARSHPRGGRRRLLLGGTTRDPLVRAVGRCQPAARAMSAAILASSATVSSVRA